MMRILLLSFVLFAFSTTMSAQPKPELLWPNGALGAQGTADEDKPTLTMYTPKGARNRTAVVVCPGGGYRNLAMDHEGVQVATWLNSLGVTAFVLKYRLGPKYHHPTQMHDVQRALRLVRSRAAELSLDAQKIGVWGFSAGGHLASTAATHFAEAVPDSTDPVERVHSVPDFAILVYPVISLNTEYVHKGSRTNLLGDKPTDEEMRLLSNDLQVTKRTPPTFLIHTSGDTGVPAENSVLFYLALRKAGVPAEMHIYEHGPHGFGLGSLDAVLSSWPARLADWMRGRGVL
jgi:acetyl esterase/lipase